MKVSTRYFSHSMDEHYDVVKYYPASSLLIRVPLLSPVHLRSLLNQKVFPSEFIEKNDLVKAAIWMASPSIINDIHKVKGNL